MASGAQSITSTIGFYPAECAFQSKSDPIEKENLGPGEKLQNCATKTFLLSSSENTLHGALEELHC